MEFDNLNESPSIKEHIAPVTTSSLVILYFEQVLIMCQKNWSQKQRNGRSFLKDSVMIQIFFLGFTALILYLASTIYESPHAYQRLALPPLSKSGNGIFSTSAPGNEPYYTISQRLYYAPNNHDGVNALISALTTKYPDVVAVGAANIDGITALYQSNLFDTWASLQFFLSEEQASNGSFIIDQTTQTTVGYSISINPNTWQNPLPDYNFTTDIYNKQVGPADLFWSTGYFTLQNFIDTYLAQQYNIVPDDFTINTEVQRYPPSPIYPDQQNINIKVMRQAIWKWIGGVILSIVLFVPLLSYLIEIVRERQFMMKELLDISGLMNVSYWSSYLLMTILNGQFSMWVSICFLLAFGVFDIRRVAPYAALCTVFIFGAVAYAMMFGFLVPRSEYYGLPIFIFTAAISVGGAYIGNAVNISTNLKLFFVFLHPSIGLTTGVLDIENYLYFNDGDMDYQFVNYNKNYPALSEVIAVMIASGVFYLIMTYFMPFDWLFDKKVDTVALASAKADEIRFPCDKEDETEEEKLVTRRSVLDVQALSCIYPDGTHAVKDMSFAVRDGEVLSFLGANGAGKSTTMKMLCGTLDATVGDAYVNGFSISSQRVAARRNLGIAMQQDIIWDDINVEDHLLLFGRLRGLHGKELRQAVEAMLKSLGFPEKRKALAGTLSGGQKRRLCVGLSMIGGSKVVYLDEPTAGLDPVSRRQLWELVQKNRAGRGILLCSHFMDEADVLGDRIAIVKEGRLRAVGTSRFLKERFGLGYLLRMSMKEGGGNTKGVKAMVERFIPHVAIASNAGTEFSLRLPREAIKHFPDILEQLETQAHELGVLSYGIETTTLEEVFMRIVNEDNEQLLLNHAEANRMLTASAEERDSNQQELQKRDNTRNPLPPDALDALLIRGKDASQQKGVNYFDLLRQVLIIVDKRFYQFYRSRGQWAMGIAIPFGLAICAGVLLSTIPSDILAPNTVPAMATFTDYYPALISGPYGANETADLVNAAFGKTIDSVYVGTTYSDLFNDVNDVASLTSAGPISVDGITLNSNDYTNFTVMYNSSFPVNLAGVVTSLLDAGIKNATNGLLNIESSYNTLPQNQLNKQLNNGFFIAMIIGLIGGSFGAGISIIAAGERTSGVKHQQLASGLSNLAYWIGNFVFDSSLMIAWLITFTTILTIFVPDSYSNNGWGYIVVSGLFLIPAVLFRFYSCSYGIADVRMAQSLYFYGSLAVMYVAIQIWFNVLFTNAKGNVQDPAVTVLGVILTVLDPVFGWMLLVMFQANILGLLSQNPGKELLDPAVAGYYFYALIISMLLYGSVFVWITEDSLGYAVRGLFNATGNDPNVIRAAIPAEEDTYTNLAVSATAAPSSTPNTVVRRTEKGVGKADSDVAAERDRVAGISATGVVDPHANAIFIHGLRKVYLARGSAPSKVAVRNVSVSIPQGEIFGLLGANGAGKTTLLKIVSGLEQPTSGFAMINGYDVVSNTSAAQRSMGLCPQFDTLIERLSVRENLIFFGKVKGLKDENLQRTVEAFMAALNIKRYENKLLMQLSGGNRRKVSLAVALIGAPPTVYLDEPSTGLDPVASRLMWRLLSRIADAKSTAVVLTTHNLMEAEAVCHRVCIMKMGEMVSLGDSLHLRSTHGTGFHLELALKKGSDPSCAENAKDFILSHFLTANLIEEHGTLLNYEVPRDAITSLARAFRLLETNKERLNIEDYSLSQSTLEQVFLKQIRPNENDMRTLGEQAAFDDRRPMFRDYATAYFFWFLAAFIPGLHHFYLGNFWRGMKYLFTANEAYAGWFLDVFEMHVLVQKSVQEHGNIRTICCMNCCLDSCFGRVFCCCCQSSQQRVNLASQQEVAPEGHEAV